jgi:NADPH:quinone reductase-like Zn-dependent oxidoreductase
VQVRLSVRAAGVNPVDWKIMQGYMSQRFPLDLPAGLGSDVAGVVDRVGEGVTAFAVGDEVFGAPVTPAYAQLAIADAAALVSKLAAVPWDVAGTLAGSGGTACAALERLSVTEGETLLIHAAAGGVGTFAVQLAVARGARVIGTASSGARGRAASEPCTTFSPSSKKDGYGSRFRAPSPSPRRLPRST